MAYQIINIPSVALTLEKLTASGDRGRGKKGHETFTVNQIATSKCNNFQNYKNNKHSHTPSYWGLGLFTIKKGWESLIFTLWKALTAIFFSLRGLKRSNTLVDNLFNILRNRLTVEGISQFSGYREIYLNLEKKRKKSKKKKKKKTL